MGIETKDDARKRGVQSPDRAEALMLTVGLELAPRTAEDDDTPETEDGAALDDRAAFYRDLHRMGE